MREEDGYELCYVCASNVYYHTVLVTTKGGLKLANSCFSFAFDSLPDLVAFYSSHNDDLRCPLILPIGAATSDVSPHKFSERSLPVDEAVAGSSSLVRRSSSRSSFRAQDVTALIPAPGETSWWVTGNRVQEAVRHLLTKQDGSFFIRPSYNPAKYKRNFKGRRRRRRKRRRRRRRETIGMIARPTLRASR